MHVAIHHPLRPMIAPAVGHRHVPTVVMQAPRRTKIQHTLFVGLLLSFVPYFLPYENQPAFYHDGFTVEERRQRAEHRRVKKVLGGGDIQKMGDFFDYAPPPVS